MKRKILVAAMTAAMLVAAGVPAALAEEAPVQSTAETAVEEAAQLEAEAQPAEEPETAPEATPEITVETAELETYAAEGDWQYDTSTGNAVITGYTGSAADITIPTQLGGKPVYEIGEKAFINNTTIKSVVIPEQITKIGNAAFENCTSLANVTINAINLTDCDSYSAADYDLSKDRSVFYNAGTNAGGMKVTFGSQVKAVPAYLFATGNEKGDNVYCHVTSVVVSNADTDIGKYAFYKCYGLESVSLDGVKTIGEYAFCNSGIKSLTIPDTVSEIKEYAFADNSSLASVSFADSVTSIGFRAFENATSLKELTLPNSVLTVKDGAFQGCTTLETLVVPQKVAKLGNAVFENCTALTNVTINAINLADCDSYSAADYDLSKDRSVFYNAGTNTGGMKVTFGSEVKTVPAYLFATGNEKGDNVYCHVTSVVVSNADTDIGKYAFYKCYGLESVSLDGVKTIGEYAFCNSGIKSLTIPDTVSEIKEYAFADNSSLASVSFADSVTSIGFRAFENATSLKELTLPNSVLTVKDGAFQGCTTLETLVIPQKVAKLGNAVFENCTALTNVTINAINLADCDSYSAADYDLSKDRSVFYNAGTNTGGMKVTFGDGVKQIPAYLFATGNEKGDAVYCKITEVEIPSTVEQIGECAFYNCFDLKKVTVKSMACKFADNAFKNCTSKPVFYCYNGSTADFHAKKIGCEVVYLSGGSTGVEGFVDRLYSVCLGRNADAAGKADWVGQLTSYQISGTKAAFGFIFSKEFTNMNYSNEDYVEHLYEAFMGRASDEGGKKDWVSKLENRTSREEVFYGFANSAEFDNICKSYGIVSKDIETFVTRLYSVCLNRQPDENGLADWAGRLRSGAVTGKAAASGFVFSEEFTNKNYSNEDYVEHLYAAFMGRASDAAGKADWVGKLNSGVSREDVFNGFAGSAEFDAICSGYGIVRG